MNKDIVPHTATSKASAAANTSDAANNERFDSKTLQPGASWTYTITTKGTFTYVCTFHPTMTGTLKVK